MQLHQVALQPLNAAPTCLRAASRPSLPARTRPACRHSSVASLKQKVVGRRVLPPSCAAVDGQKQMQAWNSQVTEGRVRNIAANEVKAMQADGWTVLDVRPPYETSKAPISNAIHVPLFIEDPDNSLATYIKKATDFGMGGWWLGGTHNIPNANFSAEVKAKLPSDARVIVVCQKGLRSLAACETLARLGYNHVAWVNGGLDTACKADIDTENGVDIRYGGIGGLSEVLGWTEVQREENPDGQVAGGLLGIIKFFAVILGIDLLVFAYEQITYLTSQGGQ
uniref:Rhodanese domain-containing protein n=1 Tax=Dunaliella tertiolecta TaxID=3047 RepID=A0A7S3RAI1_DUNTE|eukprot:CAMPEP_0202349978 /NCGR_PEP_ID=MMETSP1126-20121109/7240_1 /ASSEMBLY_ACC=CAM_ASM_000457 /TAXON_ID=3047 /ORGANISM="Dunaliella tertiolecta, Strain CCMP1320" /LENGTH=279 /DNA_ID=CAMNT_0048941869 /DNA_START=43 /DNA_END=882 /DNA_ORIENTATION=-